MAQTKKKRSRKHRGTPAGNIERPANNSRAKSPKKDAKQISRDRRAERLNKPPTWRGSVNRAAAMAAIFGIFVAIVKKSPAAGAFLAVVMLLLYIPLSYYTDLAIYNFRQRRQK